METYNDYSRMFSRSAGQFWSNTQVMGQWAWNPQSATEAHIGWGVPATWPPEYKEKFIKDGDWVYLDGWYDNGTYYKINTTAEWIVENGVKTLLPTGGAEHYVKWVVPDNSYSLHTEATITEQSSGNTVHFIHDQTWSKKAAQANYYNAAKPCIVQYEQYSDDHDGTMVKKVDRTIYIAKGMGMAWYSTPSNTSGRYYWNW